MTKITIVSDTEGEELNCFEVADSIIVSHNLLKEARRLGGTIHIEKVRIVTFTDPEKAKIFLKEVFDCLFQ